MTNVLQVVRRGSENPNVSHSIRLEGTVWWANAAQGRFVLKDETGVVELEMDLASRPVQPGQRVRVAGNGTIVRRGAGFIRLGTKGPVVDNLRLEVIGRAEFPEPRLIVIGQTLRDGEDGQWAEVEGKVTFVKEEPAGVKLELSAGADRMQVEIADGSSLLSMPLLNSRIRAVGFCQSAFTITGQKVPGLLLVPGRKEIEFIETPPHRNANGDTNANSGTFPVLTTAAAVNQMKREEAEQGPRSKSRAWSSASCRTGMPSLCRMPPARFMWLWIRQSFPNCRRPAPIWKWKGIRTRARLPRLCGHAMSTSWVWGACRIPSNRPGTN